MSTQAKTLQFSLAELEKLKKESSPEVRATIARSVAQDYASAQYNASESLLALEIIRILARDAETIVRRSISEELLRSFDLPRDIALKIASDVQEVSIPFLAHSWALSEEDLVELTRATQEVEKLLAIASRESISFNLSGALLKKEVGNVTLALFKNKGALLREEDVATQMPLLVGDETLLEALVQRGSLSVKLAEKLFDIASDTMKSRIARTYNLSTQVAQNITGAARDKSTLKIAQHVGETDIEKLVDQLHARGRLSFSVLLRALSKGDLRFFEIALARMADIPVVNARILLLDPGDMGFRSLYQAAQLPENFYQAISAAVHAMLEETGFGRFTRRDLRLRVHARLKKEDFAHIENMDYLVGMMGSQDHDSTTYH